ncbi:phosphoserine phosphatase, chloroplastic isoform X4 [Capsicum annuum]|uniref:phosphoserine phosphatase, chloroplastic isoform X4 n=1 Tax=Capsicum annuum TaxID=4072 RepID=UPI001FB07044|nr:phosphoserine phosphatase, chloroplastic isoform X4 [Capsicum annuum]
MEGLMNFQANSAGAVSKQQQNSPLEAFAVTPFDNTLPSKEVLDVWQNANAVCFDVDSTVCIDEGIDEFAEFCGAGKAVAEWTARAMNGSVPFEEALAARLSLINPSLKQLQDFLKRPPRLSPGIDLLVKNLKDKNKDVYLVSGGFRQMINPVASILGIPLENIFANQILFGSNGEYVGFDKNEPTSRRGGKATAVQQIRKAHGYKSLVMIGDGATDLEILPFSPIFVAGSYARWCGLVCLLRRNSTTRISCS